MERKLRKTHCVRGHSIAEAGRFPSGACKACGKIFNAAQDPARKKANDAAWRKNNPDNLLNNHWARYPILNADGSPFRVENYKAAFDLQGGVCKVCRTPAADLKKRLYVDHDHATSIARGLLCEACNFAIGQLRDNPSIARAAAAYLEAYQC